MTTTLPAAAAVAEHALHAAGVVVRPLDTLDRVLDAEALLGEVWRSPTKAPLSAEVMRAVEHAGGYVVGAYDDSPGSTRMLAASSAFLALGPDGRVALHSHISGVLAHAQGRRVGWALKLHQRAWCLERGIETVTWTFDPLVRRNAWFNLAKLGAVGVEYLVDFYGPMSDGLNAGEPTDRLFTRWQLLAPEVVAAVGAVGAGAQPATGHLLLDERDGGPAPGRPAVPGERSLVRLPADVEALRIAAPERARAWRLAVRDVLAPLVDRGARVTGMTGDGCLLVEP
ncbi:MAG: GNAT family N-acetyltransferase [Frankiales bacterium]|nr:MAG: GNAT family N-acetyltransferase [Frankiales bacterium]